MKNDGAEHRALAAIRFTDIVGYTSLTQWDETLALELLSEHRQLLRAVLLGGALVILRQLEDYLDQGLAVRCPIALVHLGLGDRDKAFAWLGEGLGELENGVHLIKEGPLWEDLRGDPRYASFVVRLGYRPKSSGPGADRSR